MIQWIVLNHQGHNLIQEKSNHGRTAGVGLPEVDAKVQCVHSLGADQALFGEKRHHPGVIKHMVKVPFNHGSIQSKLQLPGDVHMIHQAQHGFSDQQRHEQM